MPLPCVARIYKDVLKSKPTEYWDYENFTIEWGGVENYKLTKVLGCGKFSQVFEAMNISNGERCVTKVLKPVQGKKYEREIKILQNLRGGTNIIKFLEAVKSSVTRIPTLIFEYKKSVNFWKLSASLSAADIRHYTFELLKALDYIHGMGIMHRDIKPDNLLVDHEQRKLTLIDFGLADFYHPGARYNVNVVARYFKGPELLVGYEMYDYSLDLWSLGCIMASMILRKFPLFKGHDNIDQLSCIVKVLGTEELLHYLDKYQINLDDAIYRSVEVCYCVKWESLVNEYNKHLATPEALDFIDKLLKYDQAKRLTAREAMSHRYFLPLINKEDGEKRGCGSGVQKI